MPRGWTIALHDPKRDTDDEIAERVALQNVLMAEVLPDEVPNPVDESIAVWRAQPDRVRWWSFRARDEDGALIGLSATSIDPDFDNDPDLLFVQLAVRAEHRRAGLGTELLGRIVEVAEAEGRTRLIGHTSGLRPESEAFAVATGAEVKSRAHENRLLTADVDRAQLEGWVRDAADRASDYELIGWDGPVSDEDIDRWVAIQLVMNTAPHDDLEVNDFTLTADLLREHDEIRKAAGVEHWIVVARHRTTGDWAGYHDVTWMPSDPTIVFVGATAVDPPHRGHALGKWLKAAMTLRILDERPQVVEIRTGNADSNDAMLGINRAMGYQHWISNATWELPVATARRFVEARRVVA
jgi:GNAT superfamily N-acetyltransferase